SLTSGSNGNCYYVGNSNEAVLVDAGLSCRETVQRMTNLGLSTDKVKAIFISHEHSDHVIGTSVLSKKFQLPVYITPITYRHSGIRVKDELLRTFTPDERISIGGLTIVPFSKYHDAGDPYSFMIGFEG